MSEKEEPTSKHASAGKGPTAKDALTGRLSKMFGWFGSRLGGLKEGLLKVLSKQKGPRPSATDQKPPKPWESWWRKRSRRTRMGLLIGGPLALIVVAGLVVFLVLFLRPVFVIAALETDAAIVSGEDVLLSVDVANEGRTSGEYELSVLLDGQAVQTELVTLAGGTREQVPVRLSGLSAGRYDISLAEWPELAQEVWVMTPAEFEIDRVQVQPNPMDLATNNEAQVLAEFTNVGKAQGSFELELTLDGQVIEVREIELGGGVSAHSTFAVTVAEPGSCQVAVNDECVDLEVYQIERPDNGTVLVNQLLGGPNQLKIINHNDDKDCAVILSAAVGKGEPPLLAVYVRAGSTHTVRRIKDGTYTCYYAIGEEWCAYRNEFTSVWDCGRFVEPMEVESPGWFYTEMTTEFGLAPGESSPSEEEASLTEDLSLDDLPDISAAVGTTTGSPPAVPATTVVLPPAPEITVLWKFRAADIVHSDPTVASGVVYCGSDDRYLYAVDASTGEEKWKFETEGKVSCRPTVSGGVVYCGSNDGYLHALDIQTGEQKWKFEAHQKVTSSPAISDGVVYFGSGRNCLYAVDAASGLEKWNFRTGYDVVSSPAVSDGVVYFGSRDYNLYALDAASGQEKWRFRADDQVHSSPSVSEGTVYFGSDDHYLYAVDASTGEEKWKFETHGRVSCRPTVSDGVVYFGSFDGYLYALDTLAGWEWWKFRTDGHVVSSPAVSGGVVYCGSNDGYLYALDIQTGEQKWKFETGDRVTSSPAVSDGVVYFGGCDKYLYALKIE